MVQGIQGYLKGNTTLPLAQRLYELALADQQSSGLPATPSSVSPTLNPTQSASQVLPAFTSQSNGSGLVAVTNIGTGNLDLSPTINLGTGGTFNTKQFQITYVDVSGNKQAYNFSLLPAMETNLRSNSVGTTVPEVKPGILVRTSMSYKRFAIPGAAPVFQSLGIEQTILQLVGLFIGTEGSNPIAPDNILYGDWSNTVAYASAYKSATQFDQQAVQSGREVQLYIYANSTGANDGILMQYTCVLQNFRYFVARSDRVYYSMDALVIDYQTQRLAMSTAPSSAPSAVSTLINQTADAVRSITSSPLPSFTPSSNVNPGQETLNLD